MTQLWEQSRGQGQGAGCRPGAGLAGRWRPSPPRRSPAAAHPGHHGAEAWARRGEPGRGHGLWGSHISFPAHPWVCSLQPPTPRPGTRPTFAPARRQHLRGWAVHTVPALLDPGPPPASQAPQRRPGGLDASPALGSPAGVDPRGQPSRGALHPAHPRLPRTIPDPRPSLSLHGDEEWPPMSPARPVGLGGGCACPLPLVRFPISEEGAEDPPSGHPRDFHQRGLHHRLSPSVQTHPGHPRVPGGDTGRQDLERRGCDPDGPGQRGFHPEMVTGKGRDSPQGGRAGRWLQQSGRGWRRHWFTCTQPGRASWVPSAPRAHTPWGLHPRPPPPQSPRWLTEEAPASADEDSGWPQNAPPPQTPQGGDRAGCSPRHLQRNHCQAHSPSKH